MKKTTSIVFIGFIIGITGILFSQTLNIIKKDGSTESFNLSDIKRISFTMERSNTVTDIDGNVYHTVQIGSQVWMAENYKVTHYRNGDPIHNVTDGTEWTNLSIGAYCYFDNDISNSISYGALYNWYAVNDSRNIAPEGWHVPTDDDWKALEMYLGMSQSEADDTGYRGSPVGGKLKETGTIEAGTGLWFDPNAGATNESGFSARPGGIRSDFGIANFFDMSNFACYWSATELDNDIAIYRTLYDIGDGVGRNNINKNKRGGFSIRLVRD